MSNRFASAFRLDSKTVHLNHGSFGAVSRDVYAFQEALRKELEADPDYFFGTTYEELLYKSLNALAVFVGVDSSDIVLVPNATYGVNAVLESLDLCQGDELLVTDHAYNACSQALEKVAAESGSEVVVAKIPFPISCREQVVSAVLNQVSSRTRICLLDHITSPTAIIFPIKDLVKELHARDVLVLVDGAHAPGMVELNLTDMAADFYVANCHKWLCSPRGAGFLYVHPAHRDSIHPVVTSHGRNALRSDRSRFHLEFHWSGTVDPTAWCSIEKSLLWLEGVFPGGIKAIREFNHCKVLEMRNYLSALWETEPLAPEDMLGAMAAVQLPRDLKINESPRSRSFIWEHPLCLALRDAGITVPVISWANNIGDFVRISYQIYNEKSDYERLGEFIVGNICRAKR